MSFWTLVVTNFGAGAARYFFAFQNGELRLVGVHAKLRNGIAPNGKDVLFKRCCDVHHAGIMGKYIAGSFENGGRLIDVELSTSIVNQSFFAQF